MLCYLSHCAAFSWPGGGLVEFQLEVVLEGVPERALLELSLV